MTIIEILLGAGAIGAAFIAFQAWKDGTTFKAQAAVDLADVKTRLALLEHTTATTPAAPVAPVVAPVVAPAVKTA